MFYMYNNDIFHNMPKKEFKFIYVEILSCNIALCNLSKYLFSILLIKTFMRGGGGGEEVILHFVVAGAILNR